MSDPLTVAAAAADALNRGEWRSAADLVDPDELQAWYDQHLNLPEHPAPRITAEQIKRRQPDMPDEVARYQADRFNRRARESHGSFREHFADVQTKADLACLEPAEAFACYLEAQDPTWQFENQLKDLEPEVRPHARQGTGAPLREVVGVVYEGEQLAHVVYRLHWDPTPDRERDADMAVATLRRTNDGWRLRLAGNLFAPGSNVLIIEIPDEHVK